MKIRVKISRTNEIKEIDLESGSTINDILKIINLKPDTVVVMNKDKPIPIDEKIPKDNDITIIQVSSGG